MSYSLSLLDKSPIADGANAADALRFTTTLAQRAEQLGYERFWVAEHHGTPAFASSAPEIVVAHLLAHTSRIRVGSGGVMLQHYSPFKVAETFKVLAALAPGRVDLGIGKAPGGLPLTTRALQWFHDKARKPDFAGQLAELDAFLGWGVAEDHPLAGAVALPVPPQAPNASCSAARRTAARSPRATAGVSATPAISTATTRTSNARWTRTAARAARGRWSRCTPWPRRRATRPSS